MKITANSAGFNNTQKLNLQLFVLKPIDYYFAFSNYVFEENLKRLILQYSIGIYQKAYIQMDTCLLLDICVVSKQRQSWRSGTKCDCKTDWLWDRSPLEEMKYTA